MIKIIFGATMKPLQNNLTKIFSVLILALTFSFTQSTYAAAFDDNVEFVDLDGKKVMLHDFKGKWVVVNLWATWCPPCLKEIPDLVMFHDKYSKNKAVVLGVNYEDIEPFKVRNFAESQMVNFPIVRFPGKTNGKTTPFGPLRGLPTTYVVNPKGETVAARTGMITGEQLEEFINVYESKMK